MRKLRESYRYVARSGGQPEPNLKRRGCITVVHGRVDTGSGACLVRTGPAEGLTEEAGLGRSQGKRRGQKRASGRGGTAEGAP